jgi:hypothetical protein
MSDGVTPPPLPLLAVDYVPTHEDILHGRRFLFRRTALFHPTVLMFNAGSLLFVAGAVMMGTIGSSLWLTAACFGFLFIIMLASGFWKLAPTRKKVEEEIAARAWLRTPAHVQLTDDAMVYDHGPLHARLTWPAVARVVETNHALLVMEKAAPGAFFYCLPKRELDKTPAGSRGWRDYLTSRLAR